MHLKTELSMRIGLDLWDRIQARHDILRSVSHHLTHLCEGLSAQQSSVLFLFLTHHNHDIKCCRYLGFNAQNHYVLGWFEDRTYEFGIASSSKLLNVAAFIDYSVMLEEDENNDREEYIIVRIGDVYLQYNFAEDYNRDTSEMNDKLTIVQVREYGTELLAGLGVGDSVTTEVTFQDNEGLENQDSAEKLAVMIHVCGVYNSSRSQATNSDVMIVSVKLYDNESDENDVTSLCEQASVQT